MRIYIVILILAVVSYSALRADDRCDKISASPIKISGLPQRVAAGKASEPVTFEIEEKVAALYGEYEFAVVQVNLSSGSKGAWQFNLSLEAKTKEKKLTTKFEETLKVPATAQGIYKPTLFFTGFPKGGTPCYAKLTGSTEEGIEVPSHPDADIHPPVISNTRLDKKMAKKDEEVSLRFNVDDKEKSKICTGEAKEKGLCTERTTFHLEFRAGEESFNTWDPIHHLAGDLYEIRFKISADAKPGKYTLETLNIFDRAGNGSSSVDEKEKLTTLEILKD